MDSRDSIESLSGIDLFMDSIQSRDFIQRIYPFEVQFLKINFRFLTPKSKFLDDDSSCFFPFLRVLSTLFFEKLKELESLDYIESKIPRRDLKWNPDP